jgi:hypothetical protein
MNDRLQRVKRTFTWTILLAAAAVNGCGDRGGDPVANPLALRDLQNAEYPSQWPASGRARLVNGRFREAAAPGAATDIVVRTTDNYAFGDLDGDGDGDAVVVLESDPGGSGVFFDLAAVLNRDGIPYPMAPVPLGDRVQVNDVSIREGNVRVDLVKHGPDDPQCCPTLDVSLQYRMEENRLVPASQDPSRASASPSTR